MPATLEFNVPGNDALMLPAHRMVCYEWGDREAAETVLCLHGLTRNGRDFDFLAHTLSARYRVLCPDMPGRGNSEWLAIPAAYNYATYVADVAYLLAALKLSRIHWIGTSMGGIIGMTIANTLPGVIRSMVLNDIGPLVAAAGLKRILGYAGARMIFSSRAEAEKKLRELCAPFGIRDEAHWQHLFAHSIVEENGRFRFAYDPAISTPLVTADAVVDIDLWHLWQGMLPIPLLLVRGETSDILTRATALEMQEHHPDLTYYEVKNAGHAPALMDDSQVGFVREWLLKRE